MLPVSSSPHLPLSCDVPSVDEIDVSGYTGAAGDEIVVRASDDFDPSAGLRAGPSTAPSTGLRARLRAGVVGVNSSATPSASLRPRTDEPAEVARLRTGVALTDAEGNPIESGEAVETPPDGGRWVYTATAAVETGTTVRPSTLRRSSGQAGLRTGIAVTATDGSTPLTTGRPGGVAEAEEEKAV